MLMGEIEDSTTRISALVGAAKQYSQMDRRRTSGSTSTTASTPRW